MAGVLVSASTGVMNSVIGKLATLMGEEYKKHKSMQRDVAFLKDELASMNAVLSMLADMEEELDPQTKEWRNQVMDMAFDIEDCVDEFMHHGGGDDAVLGFVRETTRRLKKLRARRQIANQMQELKARVKDVSERRQRYNLDECASSSRYVAVDHRMPALYMEAANLVGMDGPKGELMKLLALEEEGVSIQCLKVVSIFEFGGLGKTALANSVYHELREQYDCEVFVSVSLRPDLIKLLSRISSILRMPEGAHIYEVQDLIDNLREHLKDKRHFAVRTFFACIKGSAARDECLATQPIAATNPLFIGLSFAKLNQQISAIASTGSSRETMIDRRLMKAAITGDSRSMKDMASQDPSVLLGTTPHGNTCLHISSLYGHEGFCKDVLILNQSLLAVANSDGETPLLTAVTNGHASLASDFLWRCRALGLSEAILKQDKDGCNALHHAIRSGHKDIALELIATEPALSQFVNNVNESPMCIAVLRDFVEVFEKLLEVPNSAHTGVYGFNALHAAVRNGNSGIVQKIMEKRPWLAREENKAYSNPIHLAILWDKVDVLRVMLEHDWSLGHVLCTNDIFLNSAAFRGHVGVARVLLDHCPDTPYRAANGWTCLHAAVKYGHTEFVEFILREPQLRKLVNMRDRNGKTALHYAVQKCNPKIVAALLFHKDIDFTMFDNNGYDAAWELVNATDHAKTLNWNEVSMLMLKADPRNASSIYNLHMHAKEKVTNESRKDIKSLTQTYTSNTSLVAILIATITFAAAFTLPGGYSTDSGSEGLPIMARKFAFQAFLISDTLAMCSSLVVAFICIIARWEDLEFLLYYRSFTKKLMWFAYIATTTAFATGLYTVLAPRLPWLAIAICFLPVLLPVLAKLLGEWPVLKLRVRLGQTFKSDFLNMV